MALEAMCGMSARGKLHRGGPFEQEENGFDVREDFLTMSKDPESICLPAFVSHFIRLVRLFQSKFVSKCD